MPKAFAQRAAGSGDDLNGEVLRLRTEVDRLRPVFKAAKAWRAATSVHFDEVSGSADALSKAVDAVRATEQMLAAVVDEAVASEVDPPGRKEVPMREKQLRAGMVALRVHPGTIR